MKTAYIIAIIVAIILVLIGGFFLSQNKSTSSQTPNQIPDLSQNTFSSCQASARATPFGQGGTYIVRIIGLENELCHWQFSLEMPQVNQTNDCFYPIEQMSDKASQHLFGMDKTGTECLSDTCKQQESLQAQYCKQI